MFIDSHCHLFDLKRSNPNYEDELKNTNIIVVSSSTDLEEFKYNEEISNINNKEKNKIYLSFAIHPQLCASRTFGTTPLREGKFGEYIMLLEQLASEKRIAAVGECGFDLYNDEYKATEKWQDEVFAEHLEIAIKYDLPVILHVRRAMHKIFEHTNKLKKCKSIIFHSWPGTLEEGQALLRRGVNAYFSFGNTILNGHKQQVRSCAGFPIDRILTETDAPYQPAKGSNYSSWKDLPRIINTISSIRNISVFEIESQIKLNFYSLLNFNSS